MQKYGGRIRPLCDNADPFISVVGPKTRNGLPVDLRHLPNGPCSQFHHLLKTSFPLGLGRERL